MDVCFCLYLLSYLVHFIDVVKNRLGKGGTGEVFVVEKVSIKKKMVLKVLRLGIKGTDEFKKNTKVMEAEIQVGIKLGSLSKFLVQLTEFFIEEEYCCLIMEFCTGGDLEKFFEEKNRIPQPVSFFYLINFKCFII
jgi:serine/threonine protein kinase